MQNKVLHLKKYTNLKIWIRYIRNINVIEKCFK